MVLFQETGKSARLTRLVKPYDLRGGEGLGGGGQSIASIVSELDIHVLCGEPSTRR